MRQTKIRSSHPLTCGIWTFGRRAFPTTSARARPCCCGTAVSTARRCALLYRGMLSRLAHVHRIPIRDSSTEGDCLALAASHLRRERASMPRASSVMWQRFVLGGQQTQAATVYGLCDDFRIRCWPRRRGSIRSRSEDAA